jgi:hypothetical protein
MAECDSIFKEFSLCKACLPSFSAGLAIYGSGSEGSSSDSDDDGSTQVSGKGNFHRGRDSGDDSDGELKVCV